MSERAIEETIAALRDGLLAARAPQGHWEGRLSSSARKQRLLIWGIFRATSSGILRAGPM